MTDPLSFEDFQPLVGQPFTLQFGEEQFGEEQFGEIVLLECTLGAAHHRSRSFTLLFRAGPDGPREQGNYLLSREDFGPSPIFLVPVRATPDGVELHAVFNQLTEE
ncbi:MAG: hypothetical protein QOE53_2869 [Pseudonocardiales bacterium]|jgi:hypothetical protein|nr:hypothetical protein [Pseudonocardiales bacterium]